MPIVIGKLSIAPKGTRFSPLMLVIVTSDGLSMVMPWSSMNDLLTTDPDAPESIIRVTGIPFILAAQHKAVVRVAAWLPKVLTSSLVRRSPFVSSERTDGAICKSWPKVMLAC